MGDFTRGLVWGAGFVLGATTVFIVMVAATLMGLTFLGMLAGA